MELIKKNKKALSTVKLFWQVVGTDAAGCGSTVTNGGDCRVTNLNNNNNCPCSVE